MVAPNKNHSTISVTKETHKKLVEIVRVGEFGTIRNAVDVLAERFLRSRLPIAGTVNPDATVTTR